MNADISAELDAQIKAYIRTLSAAEALNLAGHTAHQIEDFAGDGRLDEYSLRLNTRLYGALVRAFLIRVVEAGPITVTEDRALFEGFGAFLQGTQKQFAAATGLGLIQPQQQDGDQ